jgi:hypothetical protein
MREFSGRNEIFGEYTNKAFKLINCGRSERQLYEVRLNSLACKMAAKAPYRGWMALLD